MRSPWAAWGDLVVTERVERVTLAADGDRLSALRQVATRDLPVLSQLSPADRTPAQVSMGLTVSEVLDLDALGESRLVAGLDGARFIFALSLPFTGTVRQMLMASPDTPGLYVASADLQAGPDSPATDLEFRRPTPFDPPLLTAVPLLWRS